MRLHVPLMHADISADAIPAAAHAQHNLQALLSRRHAVYHGDDIPPTAAELSEVLTSFPSHANTYTATGLADMV